MAKVLPGRYAGTAPDGVVVFLIGMRLNRPLKPHKWVPVFWAMVRMLRELDKHPEKGLLGVHPIFLYGGPAFVQFWSSFEDLERFARAADDPHLPAWQAFNQKVRDSGEVGIWHETFRVEPGAAEALYGNMPLVGLGKVASHVPVGSTSQTAALRLGNTAQDTPPVAPY